MHTMSGLPWIAALETGIPEIDSDHRQLVDGANRLLEGLFAEQPWPEILDQLAAMRDQCFAHFAREERLLKMEEFPKFAPHAAEHRRIEGEIDAIKAGVEAAPERTDLAVELVLSFRALLIDHLIRYDLAYKSHLQARRNVRTRSRSA